MAKMLKVTVELELDQEAYDKMHGPGSENFAKYRLNQNTRYMEAQEQGYAEALEQDKIDNAQAVVDYAKERSLEATENMIVDILDEGLYDYSSQGWVRMKVNGKVLRICCRTLESEPHKPYCDVIAGPEASA